MTARRDTYQHHPRQPGTRSLQWLVGINSGWMLFGAVGRVLIQLQSHLPLDPLPFISFALGAIGISALAVGFARDHA